MSTEAQCFDIIKQNGFLKNFNDLYECEQHEIMKHLIEINKCIGINTDIEDAYEDLVCNYRVKQLGPHYAKI